MTSLGESSLFTVTFGLTEPWKATGIGMRWSDKDPKRMQVHSNSLSVVSMSPAFSAGHPTLAWQVQGCWNSFLSKSF